MIGKKSVVVLGGNALQCFFTRDAVTGKNPRDAGLAFCRHADDERAFRIKTGFEQLRRVDAGSGVSVCFLLAQLVAGIFEDVMMGDAVECR